jgi:hypothetical protein
MHLITDRWMGKVSIPQAYIYAAQNVEDVVRQAVENIISRIAEEVSLEAVYDVEVRWEDFIIQREEDGSRDAVVIHAEWHPCPEHGVQFIGGTRDGQIMGIPRGESGFAPGRVNLERYEENKAHERTLLSQERYRRAGIDPTTSRWVYELED